MTKDERTVQEILQELEDAWNYFDSVHFACFFAVF